ncbi:MAG: hypothetical protein ACRCX8_00160 [Sarcina sp.]
MQEQLERIKKYVDIGIADIKSDEVITAQTVLMTASSLLENLLNEIELINKVQDRR